MPSSSPRILSCIQKKNTFRSNIILLENKSLKRISNLSMLVQNNKSLISSLNLYLGNHLNIFTRSLGFSKFSLDFPYSKYKGGLEVCTGPQDGFVSGGATLCHWCQRERECCRNRCHDHSGSTYVSMNAKGGDFWSKFVIDVNPRSTRGYPNVAWEFWPTKLLYSKSRIIFMVSTCAYFSIDIWHTT